MAAPALSTSRRALLGAAAALPIAALSRAVRAEPVEAHPSLAATGEWNTRLAHYRRLAERAKVAAETGWFRTANDLYYRACAYPTAGRESAFARLDRAEDLYWRRCTAPMQEAAVALVLTPVPHLEALRTKLGVIRAHHLNEEGSLARNCIEVLAEDAERLDGGAA
ncbi:MAG: hypothetical protein E6G94_09195 [Alphaproteobacteria bacterium]|nr:MAG: hypothetical protein E6G94_09195 [Alphaproteobacteria bacterium]